MENKNFKIISGGIASGKALVYSSNYDTLHCKEDNVEKEISNMKLAIYRSVVQLENIKSSNMLANDNFIDAHILLLKDETLMSEIEQRVRNNKDIASKVFEEILNRHINMLQKAETEYLKERILDLKDVKFRVLRNLFELDTNQEVESGIILVVDELMPSLLLDLNKNIKGCIASHGGQTSHSAILCRSLGIPYVIADIDNIKKDDSIIIDCYKNILYVNPSESLMLEYEYLALKGDLVQTQTISKPDDYKIFANVSSNQEIKKAISANFDGVGLYRTEFIFMQDRTLLDEDFQFNFYKEAVIACKGKPICFRTFDCGDDKKISSIITGKKGVQNYFNNMNFFKTQIRALLRSSEYGNIKIMFPMIEHVEDFNKLRDIVFEEMKLLNITKKIEVGMMLETKEAYDHLESFKDVPFMSVGTNDLVQELYHILRDEVTNYDSFMQDLLDKLQNVINFCNENKITLSVCGEIAGVYETVLELYKRGLRNVSIAFGNLNSVVKAIKKCEREKLFN